MQPFRGYIHCRKSIGTLRMIFQLRRMASKRPHLSNPMCSVSGTWGVADVSANAGFEDAAQLRIGIFIRTVKSL